MRDLSYSNGNPLNAIVGVSKEIRRIKEVIRRVAHGDFPVLLEGETGTGKELAARVIHALSDRNFMPFIPVNCSAIPRDLMESEFFGYKKGSFTGANSDYKGLFGAANKGVLFLDEIVEMPVSLQTKLLRAIEDREIKRIGDSKYTRVDVRILAATNQDVDEAIEKGKLRKDLYYRLACVRIKIPPLRDRLSDIPVLAKFFISRFNRKYKKRKEGVTKRALEAMMFYRWPGNVRELKNVIQKAYILSDRSYIDTKDLPPVLLNEERSETQPSSETIEDAEKKAILEALRAAGGNKTKAAKLLNIGRRTLYLKLQKYNLRVK